MSVNFRTKNALLLAKLETTSGTDAAPVPASDAIRVRDAIAYSATFDQMDTSYVQESVTQTLPIIGGGMVGMKLGAWMTGAAAPGTTPPDWTTLLKGCAFGEVLTSAPIVGTSQAVGANTITLAAGASAVDDFYLGMPIDGTSGSINGQRAWIIDYVGSTKIATVSPPWTAPSGTPTYSIPANALYTPITLAQKTLTFYGYQHDSISGGTSRLRKLLAGIGSASISIQPRKLASIDFTFQGQLPAAPADVSRPANGTFIGVDPQPFIAATAYLNGIVTKFNDFSLDLGNQLTMYDDPGQAFGYDTGEVTKRVMAGRIVPPLAHIASRDNFSDFLSSTSRSLILAWGTAAGKKISLTFPVLRYTGNEPGDVNNYQVEGIPFRAGGNPTLDQELLICIS